MAYAFEFAADRTIKGKIYPALATHCARPYTASWREFEQHWPFTTPLRLEEYCQQHQVAMNIHNVHNIETLSYYVISLGFFDFAIDYFALLPDVVWSKVRDGILKILFYYHEGDNPKKIKQRLDSLCKLHQCATDCYVFVSSNSVADSLPGFVTFHDFELWYWQRNREVAATEIWSGARSHDFTVLCRLHKSWRLMVMADLAARGVLANSIWSYCEKPNTLDFSDCPIEFDQCQVTQQDILSFCQQLPHQWDALDQQQRNNHAITDAKHFQSSYCNIVIESQFDVDSSNGVFLTEKTFKPIKHGQMFFIAGAQGSLQALRDLGYRVFDGILDNSYDLESVASLRWSKLATAIQAAQPKLASLHQQALDDIKHNQKLFLSNKDHRLNRLIEKIHGAHSK